MTITVHPRHRGPSILVGTLALTATAALAGPTLASSGSPSEPARAAHTIMAVGLNSPRQLSFGPNGALYVTEAGTGGTTKCVPGGESQLCFGRTGSVTRLWRGHQRRVLHHLPSLGAPGGGDAIGPADIRVWGQRRFAMTIGAGIDLTARRQLGAGARQVGTLVMGRFGHGRHIVADVLRHEWRTNPDHSAEHDSNANGLLWTGHGHLVADSGGNTLVRARMNGRVRTVAVFPDRMVPLPPEMGGGSIPMQAVPTSVAQGPDGAYYVSQLTGFPFPAGGARIFRVVPGKAPKVWASGLTNVTDLTWHRHRLYAVQLADAGLLSAGPNQLPTGSLVRVRRGDNARLHTIAHFKAPYGVAIRHHDAYVSTCTVCSGKGTVVRVRLP